MKRQLLSITLAISALLPAMAQNAYLSEDFQTGIPTDWALYDLDGNEPSTDMAALGFSVGTPWINLEEGTESNKVAASTSWYKKAGTSNDWMVTRSFTVNDAAAVLSWRSRTSDQDYRDGYKVYISTTGNKTTDFTSDPVFSVSKETYAWSEHQIALTQYAGQTIWVAFVNTSKDRAMLYVDDVFAGIPSCISVSSELSNGAVTKYGDLNFSGKVTAKEDISSFSITLTLDDQSVSQTYEKSVKAGASAEWTLDTPIHIDRNTSHTYTLTAAANNGDQFSLSGHAYFIAQKVVAEEVTGTWCGYCVRGIVAMEQMREEHPDDYIGIAVHCGSNNWPDAMAFDAEQYLNPLFNGMNMSGYPHCSVNRQLKWTGDPANIPYYYNQVIATTTPKAGIILTADYDATNNQITAHTNTFFCANETGADYRQVYVLLENNVHGNGFGYYQNNYYSGSSGMGDFSNWPSVVPDSLMYYPDVARAIYGTYSGIEGIYDTELTAGEAKDYDYVLDSIPSTLIDRRNVELAVLLLNKSGIIINADKISLANVDGFCGIQTVRNENDNVVAVNYYTLDGRRLEAIPATKAICIKVEHMADGTCRSTKVMDY